MFEPSAEGGKLTRFVVFGETFEVILVQVDEGKKVLHRGRTRRSDREVTIDREWTVFLPDGTFIGVIRYEMKSRERRVGHRTWAEAQWSSPAWMYRSAPESGAIIIGQGGGFEGYTKGGCVERLVSEYKRRNR